MIGTFALGFLICYLIFGMKKAQVVTNTVYVNDTMYLDTCFAVSVDSMEIYRAIKHGLQKKVTLNVSPPTAITIENPVEAPKKAYQYNIDLQDSLINGNVSIVLADSSEIISTEFDYRLDTFELIRLFRIVDSFPVYIEPLIIQKTDTLKVPVHVPSFGFSASTGFNYKPLGSPVLYGGLYYQDRRNRRYALRTGTDKSVAFEISLPLWKSKQ